MTSKLVGRPWRIVIAAVAVGTTVITSCTSDSAIEAVSTTTDAVSEQVAPSTTTSTTALSADLSGRWPIPDWTSIDPVDAGHNPGILADIAGLAELGGSDCLVITHDGRIVGEWYWNDTGPESTREAFSVTKSITSTLVGIAQDLGHLDIDQPASDFITEWVGTPSETVTIRNLLAQDSGRTSHTATDYVTMPETVDDMTALAIQMEQGLPPGTAWAYNNEATQVLEAVLERATGTDVSLFTARYLFGQIGMGSNMTKDVSGNTLVFIGAQMSCRDMARFGLLHLRDGEWNGEQIVSAEWVAEATRPGTAQYPDHGLLWWLHGDDGFSAFGRDGQAIVIIPELDVVVTRLGNSQGPEGDVFQAASVIPMLLSEASP